jgi:voltage-gated potassium channel
MRRQIRLLSLILLISFVSTTLLFWSYESGVNPGIHSFGDVIWWWIVSSTTVGYGDIAPHTTPGRIAAAVTFIIGIYLYTNFITLTANSVDQFVNKDRLGTAPVKAKNHVVVCEYTAFADELLQVLGSYPELAQHEVVIISDLVSVNPYPQHHFVRGVPISPTALQQANIQEAAYIFVFANTRFQEPDLKTLHTVSRIQKFNQHAVMFVEMHKPKSEFTEHLIRPVIVLDSKMLLASILRHESIDLSAYFPHPNTHMPAPQEAAAPQVAPQT